MTKNCDAAVKVPRALIARVGVTGAKAGKPAAMSALRDIPDSEALIPDALAVRVTKNYATDTDLFQEVAGCVLHWARVFADSSKKDAAASIRHARERAERAKEMVDFAMSAGVRSGRPTAAQWAVLVEAAIHAGSAFSLSVDHFRVRRPQSRTARRQSEALGDGTREKVQAFVVKMSRKVSKPQAAIRISEKLDMNDKHIYRLLCEMYPGAKWKSRDIG